MLDYENAGQALGGLDDAEKTEAVKPERIKKEKTAICLLEGRRKRISSEIKGGHD
mgnify:CR=1 FL=1